MLSLFAEKLEETESKEKYTWNSEVACNQNVCLEMKQLAEMVAAKFSEQKSSEETFGTDDEDNEDDT